MLQFLCPNNSIYPLTDVIGAECLHFHREDKDIARVGSLELSNPIRV